jgi:hypothetical protein
VRLVTRTSLAIILFSCASNKAHADYDPRKYELSIRREAHMPDDWFQCETDKDCAVAHIPCQAGIAVGRKYKAAAETAICQLENCYEACTSSMADNSIASCDFDNECVTGIRPAGQAK